MSLIEGHTLLLGRFFFPPIPRHPSGNGIEHRHVVRASETVVFQRSHQERAPGKTYIKNPDLATNLSRK